MWTAWWVDAVSRILSTKPSSPYAWQLKKQALVPVKFGTVFENCLSDRCWSGKDCRRWRNIGATRSGDKRALITIFHEIPQRATESVQPHVKSRTPTSGLTWAKGSVDPASLCRVNRRLSSSWNFSAARRTITVFASFPF